MTCYPEQELPHPKDPEYEYCLPDDGQSEIPPIPVAELMEYFHEPTCAGTLNIALESFPKKCSEKIIKTAWGLHACEQFSLFRILVVLGSLSVVTVAFVPFWLWKHPPECLHPPRCLPCIRCCLLFYCCLLDYRSRS